jgi:membrane protein implicated in regulation of membrane protease activity
MADRRLVPLGFLFAGVIALAAALVPLAGGRSFNLSFGIFAGVFVVMAAVTWRRGKAGSRPGA